MKIKLRKKLSILLFFLFSLQLFAQTEPNCVEVLKDKGPGTTIAYTNGATTSRDKTILHILKLKTLNIKQADPDGMNFIMAYNWNQNIVSDFMEGIAQVVKQSIIQKYGLLDAYDAFSKIVYTSTLKLLVEDQSTIDAIYEKTKNTFTNMLSAPRNTTQIVQCYNKILTTTQKNLYAVSHSQGGLFIYDAYSIVFGPNDKSRFSTYQIGTPAPKIEDLKTCWNQGSFKEDIFKLAPGTPPGNLDEKDETVFKGDFFHHGFFESYFNTAHSKARAKIEKGLVDGSPRNCNAILNPCFKVTTTGAAVALDPSCSTGSAHRYQWTFPSIAAPIAPKDCGNASLTGLSLPPGSYTAKLTLWDFKGESKEFSKTFSTQSGDKQLYGEISQEEFPLINILEKPIADFKPTVKFSEIKLDASISQSTSYIQKYDWTFEGAGKRTTCFPDTSVSYGQDGTYTITLQITNADGDTSEIVSKDVTISGNGDK